jgi:phosphomethylpyrimidine synthase
MNAVPTELIRDTERLSESVTRSIPGSRKIHVEGSRSDARDRAGQYADPGWCR